MIYEMSRDLEDRLRARKYPVRVSYGPEMVNFTRRGLHVVMMRDPDADDQFQSVAGQRGNARRTGVRELCTLVVLTANSTKPGAHRGDHERECEALIDAVTTEIEAWATEAKIDYITWTGGKYVLPEGDLPEQCASVQYALRLRVRRGVSALSYTGDARPEGAAATIRNQTSVRMTGAEDEDPETGCGA